MALAVGLLASACAGGGAGAPRTVKVWHLTDVHVDPFYVLGSDAQHCYCETNASCARMGSSCSPSSSHPKTAAAGPFGNSEGNCASPAALYRSAIAFMAAEAPDAQAVYFTGDFAEAGASYPCGAGGEAEAQRQVLDIITYDFETLRAALPKTAVLGSFGNHDSAPGDVYKSADQGQAWLYDNVTDGAWRPELAHDPDALASLRQGGYYAVRPTAVPKLTVISLNINYWTTLNPATNDASSGAAAEGERQMAWFASQLSAAAARGDAVHVLGHEPPGAGGGAPWLPGLWPRYAALVAQHNATVKGQFYGHIHVDEFTVTRTCAVRPPGPASYVETTGIKWCSGGGDFAPGDVFGAGLSGICPLAPSSWPTNRTVAECERVCSANATCVGFTLYFDEAPARLDACCFRTGSTASKPPDPTSTARCYEKPANVTCDGEPTGVIIPGPSLTEGYPATNPSVRLLEFDPATLALVDMATYVADLHAGNAAGGLRWEAEYSTRERFAMPDLSPRSFADTVEAMSRNGSDTWEAYKGQGDGSIFCGGYTSASAPFPPTDPCVKCPEGPCKDAAIARLNGTNVLE